MLSLHLSNPKRKIKAFDSAIEGIEKLMIIPDVQMSGNIHGTVLLIMILIEGMGLESCICGQKVLQIYKNGREKFKVMGINE
jgi:hypothetical protein